ncbi:hypothetical protein [Streptomyces sp. TLI_171]|uniref:hypothetical protein n=1 Tax=Streptomyces sp. TLI_171 TaxID=1938859 RepID=UPI000C19257B|nr:hypothetical protein [Streptomyces sp. TLI_171]RKE02934.1 hypothetical protein BX266_7537 [Streptomyces sp. TLI_171]
MSVTVTVTADPSDPDSVGTAVTTAITRAVQHAGDSRLPVDRLAPWRISGTPYSAARLTVGDLAQLLVGLPERLPVLLAVPEGDCLDSRPVRSASWDGALVLHTTSTSPGPDTLPLDLPRAAPDIAAAAERAETDGLTAGDLAQVLADLPAYAPAMAVVEGWDGVDELVLEYAADYGTCLLMETEYPACSAYEADGED